MSSAMLQSKFLESSAIYFGVICIKMMSNIETGNNMPEVGVGVGGVQIYLSM